MFEVKIFTLYPELYPGPLNTGIYLKAQEKKIWRLKTVNIRDYAADKHGSVDDTGIPINPMIVEGQLHGGIAQGAGQALFELSQYDSEGNN